MAKLLIFSDIHNDWRTLERILSVEADFYISAGDQVTWGKGLDRCGQILKTRGEKVWVLPGNHESADQIAALCDQYGLNNFHERQFAAGGFHIAGLGYSSPTPFSTPGEYSERSNRRTARPFRHSQSTGPRLPRPALRHGARSGQARRACRIHRRSRFHPALPARPFLLRPYTRSRRRLDRNRPDPRPQRRQKGLFVRIGMNPHDSRRT